MTDPQFTDPQCVRCGHAYSCHSGGGRCEVEISDWGNLDCACDEFVFAAKDATFAQEMAERMKRAMVEYVLVKNGNVAMTIEEIQAAIRKLDDYDLVRVGKIAASA